MNLDTGEIISIDTPEQLEQLEKAAREEKESKRLSTLLDEQSEAGRLIEEMSKGPSVTYKALGSYPKASCKKCYGRGFIGRDIEKNQYVPCSCVKAR